MEIIDISEKNTQTFFVCLEDWSEEMKEAGDNKQQWYERMKDKGLGVKLAVEKRYGLRHDSIRTTGTHSRNGGFRMACILMGKKSEPGLLHPIRKSGRKSLKE